MVDFEDRKVEFHILPRPKGAILPYPERAILIFEDGHTLDVGALCYLRRMPGIRKTNGGRKVDVSSLSQLRRHEVRVLIAHISERLAQSGLKKRTEFGRFYAFTLFVDWCDKNQHSRLFDNELNARAAFRDYVEELRRRVMQNDLGNNTAVSYQNLTQAILEDYLDADNLDQGLKLLGHSHHLVNPTPIPDNKSQEVVLAWCKCLLLGLSELVVDQKPYPFSLIVPRYLNWPDDRIWIFPVSAWCVTPDSKVLSKYQSYDYQNGRVYTVQEVKGLYPSKSPSKTILGFEQAQKLIEKANKDFFCRPRIHRGMLAVSAFFVMYLAATGSNYSQAGEVLWNEELEEAVLNPSTERQGFRMIKYRANNRPVSFEIGIEYMPYLRRYLQLRKYLLQGKQFDYLFFSYGLAYKESKSEPILISEGDTKKLFLILKRLTPTFPSVVPMQWRAAKQDHVIRNHDLATAAQAMQHSLITTLRKYSNGSQVTQQLEMGTYFSQVEKIVLTQRQENTGFEPNSVGICTCPGKPKVVAENLPVTPNCKGVEGCLFCDKYRVHADEIDVRKVLSARYYIQKASRLANSQEQYIKLFFATLQRIDFILGELKRRIPELAEKIEMEVDIGGELDAFWSGKLEMLMELDLA
jgi:hypothetical protein